jgi:hypothetical protein
MSAIFSFMSSIENREIENILQIETNIKCIVNGIKHFAITLWICISFLHLESTRWELQMFISTILESWRKMMKSFFYFVFEKENMRRKKSNVVMNDRYLFLHVLLHIHTFFNKKWKWNKKNSHVHKTCGIRITACFLYSFCFVQYWWKLNEKQS